MPIPYWPLSSLYFLYFCVVGGLVPYWGLYLQHLGFNGQQIGLLLAAPMLTKILLPSAWSRLAYASGKPHRVMQLGILGATVCFAMIALQQAFGALCLWLLLYSSFWNAVLPQFEALTLGHLGAQGHLYSRIRLWGSVGFVATAVSLGPLFDKLSIAHLPLVLMGFLGALLLAGLFTPRSPLVQALASSGGLRALLGSRKAQFFFAATTAFQMSYGVYYGFYSLYLEQAGYSHGQIGVLWMIGVVAEIALFWLLPPFLPRLSIEACLAASFAVGALRWAGIGLWVDNPWLLTLLQPLHAITFGLSHAACVEWMRRYFGEALQGQAQALYVSLTYGVGGATGVYVCGQLWQLHPHYTFVFAVLLAALSALLAGFGFYFHRPAHRNRIE